MEVIGYHGTNKEGAAGILATKHVNPSSGEGHWLGSGAYFFQDAPARALVWATHRFGIPRDDAVVVGCKIDLSSCLDLFDQAAFRQITRVYAQFQEYENRTGVVTSQYEIRVANGVVEFGPVDAPRGLAENYRDHALLDWYVRLLRRRREEKITAIRGMFLYGRAIYKESFLFNWAHCQIAVREQTILSEPWLHHWESPV